MRIEDKQHYIRALTELLKRRAELDELWPLVGNPSVEWGEQSHIRSLKAMVIELELDIIDYETRMGLPVTIKKTPAISLVEDYQKVQAHVAKLKTELANKMHAADSAEVKSLQHCIADLEAKLHEYFD
jgi:hypothetical protein